MLRAEKGEGGKNNIMLFPFFVGCERSGTTLFRAILDSHPEMAIPGESYFIADMGWNRQCYERHNGFATELFVSDLLKHPRFCLWDLPEEEVRKALTTPPPPESYADAIRRVFALHAHLQGKTRYGDKTPVYVRFIPLLAQIFPEARFVHIIRDGRNVALSIQEIGKRLGPKRYRNIGECAIHWRGRVELGREAGRQIGSDRYLEVRYEDLVEDPERVVRTLCEFVDLEFHNEMLRYFERAEELVSSFTNPSIQRSLFLPPTKNLRDWRCQMSKEDTALFEILAGDLLVELGYERSVNELSGWTRLTTRLRGFILESRCLARRNRGRLSWWAKKIMRLFGFTK